MRQFVILLFFSFFFVFNFGSYSEDMYSSNMDDFMKELSSVPILAENCKSEWSGEGCSVYDQKVLIKYILYFCGEVPENTHPMNRQRFIQYVSYPMLNTAFIRSWSWLNPTDMTWPMCVVCFLNYPTHPYWEAHTSFCTK